MIKTLYLSALAAMAAFMLVLIPFSVSFGRDTCVECHTNPKFRKTDKKVLSECLACHGVSGHPYKEEAVSGYLSRFGVSTAVATDTGKKESFVPSAGKTNDIRNMSLIPGGEFLMGSDDRLRDEKPAHVVYMDAFYIDKYEVTNEEYAAFVKSTGRKAPSNWKQGAYPVSKGRHPVVFVDWNDALEYCRWKGKRLPREREWEKAARGTDGRTFPWGNVWDHNKSNNPLAGYEDTRPVGSYENGKSTFGLYDVSGNVWEWVDDEYRPHPGSDYVSPEFFKYKIAKGGSWWDCMFYGCGISAPTFNRSFLDASTKNDSYGFRCAMDAKNK